MDHYKLLHVSKTGGTTLLKIKIVLSYDGSAFMGSQSQHSTANTVMGTFQKILDDLGINDIAVASGRTDRNVHANAQVLHVSIPEYWSNLSRLEHTLNIRLPHTMRVRSIRNVPDTFHARYSAQKRIYRYILSTQTPSPFLQRYVTFVDTLDLDTLNHAMALFVGEHDFKYFMKQGSDTKSSVREIYRAFAYRHQTFIVLHFEANGYLRSQIRLMVGFLLQISKHALSHQQLQEQLSCQNIYSRKLAPPNGLYLAKIKY